MLVLSTIVIFTKRIELLSLGALISFSSFIHRGSKSLSEMKPLGGYANMVTGLRLILLVVGSFLFSFISKEVLLFLMGSAVLLDLVDGYLARKFNQTSIFGQYFDMEVDAFFVLLMCFYYFQYQEVAWWILIPGLLRYAFKSYTTLFPKKDFIETKKRYAATIAGLFFAILLICIYVDLPYALLLGSAAIIISFSISWVEYIRY